MSMPESPAAPGANYGASQPGMQPMPPQYGQMPHYGYGMPLATRMRRAYPIETKPFFLTSEFAVAALATIALIITAAADNSVDSRLFWILETAIVCLYMVSRGIAKSGTRSFAPDPREHLNLGMGDGQANQPSS